MSKTNKPEKQPPPPPPITPTAAKTLIGQPAARRGEYVITREGKHRLVLNSPVMNVAGMLGFGTAYRELIKLDKLGAIVTAPISLEPRSPANGARVVPLSSGVLLHTGLPNPGLKKAIQLYHAAWSLLPVPIILHLISTDTKDMRRSMEIIDETQSIDAIEIGLSEEMSWDIVERLVKMAVNHSEKPILVRLPMETAYETAQAAADSGAHSLVVAGAPRGAARDPYSKHLFGGRVYSPTLQPITLIMVERIRRLVPHVPIIGAGGIHTPQDARDYMQAGAVAVQVDTVTWVKPQMLEIIARDLSGGVITRDTGAFSDEWHPGMGETERRARDQQDTDDNTPTNK